MQLTTDYGTTDKAGEKKLADINLFGTFRLLAALTFFGAAFGRPFHEESILAVVVITLCPSY
jgi:hypothetical protein